MSPRPFPRTTAAAISRRSLLAGAVGLAGATALAACSSTAKSSGSTSTTALLSLSSDGSSGSSKDLVLLQNFYNGPYAFPGTPQRLVLSLANGEGAFLDTGPAAIEFTVLGAGNKAIGSPVNVPLHDKGLQKGYYPLVFTPPATGNYTAVANVNGQRLTAAFQVFDKAKVHALGAGDRMPTLATPTVADHLGVDPLCTATPQCPLHAESLDTVLAAHKPIALLIATPAYCQTAICGPVLDVLVGNRAEFADRVTFIHNEVYKSGAIAAKNINAPNNLTAAVGAMKLDFEPTLVFVKPDGTIMRRLDNVYDVTELRQGLTDLVA